MNNENVPYVSCGYKRAWLMWDLDNGHAWSKNDSGKGYAWLFPTKAAALKHRKKQHKKKNTAMLSYPIFINGRK